MDDEKELCPGSSSGFENHGSASDGAEYGTRAVLRVCGDKADGRI